MQTTRIRIVSVDVAKVDLARALIFVAYVLRTPVGDNHAAADLAIEAPDAMTEALLSAARAKAALLAEVFSGLKVSPDRYQIADFRYTRDRLRPLFARLGEAAARHAETRLDDGALNALETDGVHLLRNDLDLDGKPDAQRADILRQRACAVEGSAPDVARMLAQRALRLAPDDADCLRIAASGTPPPP